MSVIVEPWTLEREESCLSRVSLRQTIRGAKK
jgi:hypothetical protein